MASHTFDVNLVVFNNYKDYRPSMAVQVTLHGEGPYCGGRRHS